MEDWDIARVVEAYADGAERVKAAGLDGLELECYGHLIDQFWSPASNKRNDAYGGPLENRMRFALEVLTAIRKRVGDDLLVGVRMVCDEDWDRGLSREEGVSIARRLAASGLIDFVNVIRGHIDTDEALSHVIPGMGARSAPHLDFAGEVRDATRMPTFHAARIQDVATARHAIESGKLDIVGMTRAHLADPHIARKVAKGREHEIRPCVGMGYCIDSIYSGEAVCIHNAATGREATIPHVIARSAGPGRKVVVVGAGPAGLEAARVAGERGHEVVVFEAAPQPGGQVLIAAGLKRRREILGIVDWRLAECARLGVAIRCNAYAEAADVLAEKPGRRRRRDGRRAEHELPRRGRGLRHIDLGYFDRRGQARGPGATLRRQRRPSRHDGGRVYRRQRIEAGGRDARAHPSHRRRRDELPRLFPRARARWTRRWKSICGSNGSSGAATRSPASSSTNTESAISRKKRTRSWSTTARRRSTSSTSS